jgi:hypothetical protein
MDMTESLVFFISNMDFNRNLQAIDAIYCKRMCDALSILGDVDMSNKEIRVKAKNLLSDIASFLLTKKSVCIAKNSTCDGYMTNDRERIMVEHTETFIGDHTQYAIDFRVVTKQTNGFTYGDSVAVTFYKPGLFLVRKQPAISVPHNDTTVTLTLSQTHIVTPIPSIIWHLYAPPTPLAQLPKEQQDKLASQVAEAKTEHDKKQLNNRLSALMSSYHAQAQTLRRQRESIAEGYRARFDEEARRIRDRYGGSCDSGYFTKCQSCAYCSAMSNLYSANNGIPSPDPHRYLEFDEAEERTYATYCIDRARILMGEEGAVSMKQYIDRLHRKKKLAKNEIAINFIKIGD